MIFGHTDLRKAVSGAKFDAESDFEIRLAVVPPKSIKNDEKPIPDISFFDAGKTSRRNFGIDNSVCLLF